MDVLVVMIEKGDFGLDFRDQPTEVVSINTMFGFLGFDLGLSVFQEV
jgi:hypothetical protein